MSRQVVRQAKQYYWLDWRQLVLCVLIGIGVCLGASQTNAFVPPTDPASHTQILAGQDALYNGQFKQALDLFTSMTSAYPADPKGYFFVALTYRWLTHIDPESSDYQEQFEQAIKKSITIASDLLEKDKNNVDALLYLAASYGYRADYYNFLKNRWDKAYDDGVEMRRYIEKAEKFVKSYIDLQLGYGLYNYYAYYYRDKIGWWRFFLSLPKGDREKGLSMLHNVREKGIYAKVEAWYFLIDIYYRSEKKSLDQAQSLCEKLHQTYPTNPFFHILLAGIYHKGHNWQYSLQTAQTIVEQARNNGYYSDYIIYQAKYLMAESLFFMGKHQEALVVFDEIIAVQPKKPSYLIPWSHLRRGTIYDLTGKKEDAAAEYKRVLKLDNVLDVHDLAKGLLKNQQNRH